MALCKRFDFARFAALAIGILLGLIVGEVKSAIVNVTTAVDGNKLQLSTIEVTSGAGNPNRVFTYEQLIKPAVVDYLSTPENNAADTVTVLGSPDISAPDAEARLTLISDAALNTGIFNPSVALPGLTVSFDQPVINGPGEDIIFFELTIGDGQSPDPFVVRKADGTGTSRTINTNQYQKFDLIPIDLAPTTYLATVGNGAAAVLNDLATGTLTSAGATANPKWHAAALNLNALGIAEGDSVQSLAILSGDGTRAVDLLLVAGLPPYVPPIVGDYDGNRVVDGADFLVWQRQLGSEVTPWGSGADGSIDGIVDAADLDVWKEHFGAGGAPSTRLNATTVPEPSATGLLIVAACAWFSDRRAIAGIVSRKV